MIGVSTITHRGVIGYLRLLQNEEAFNLYTCGRG